MAVEKTFVILDEAGNQLKAMISPGSDGDVAISKGSGNLPEWFTPNWINSNLVEPLDANDNWIGFTSQTVTYNSGTTTIDWSNGNKAHLVMTGNIATLAFTNPPTVGNCLLKIVHSGAGRIITNYDADVQWFDGGTPPILSPDNGDIDIITWYFDGSKFHGQGSLDSV